MTRPEPGPTSYVATPAFLFALDTKLGAAHLALRRRDELGFEDVLAELIAMTAGDAERRALQVRLEASLAESIRMAWEAGWQPLDLHTWLSSRHDERFIGLLGDVMVAELEGYPRERVEPRWFDQLELIGATRWWPSELGLLAARARRWRSWLVALQVGLELDHHVALVGRIDRLDPLPGEAVPASARTHDVDEKLLTRVRQLLAKAESTTFEAEAETFTAGAQALMARHRIDHAMLAASGRDGQAPGGRRIWLATPYVKEKSLLLNRVAHANGVVAVWDQSLGVATITGFPADLDTVDTLFTSLLVQATRAMHAEGTRRSRYGGSRTRSFRSSFLGAYAVRIGERLAEVTDTETATAEQELRATGRGELVPVLAQRREEVESYTRELFGPLRQRTVSIGSDGEGWARGRQAADRAQLRHGAAVEG